MEVMSTNEKAYILLRYFISKLKINNDKICDKCMPTAKD